MLRDDYSSSYDVIVIGSGMGGLVAASLLAQVGKRRVLLLERHFKLGGFTHSFRRGEYEWDPGVHYIGEMQDGAMTRRVMDLTTRRGVTWRRIGTPLERLIFPGETFEMPDEPRAFRDALIARFPAERSSIVRYFRDLRRVQGWVMRWFTAKMFPLPIRWAMTWPGHNLVGKTTNDYLAENFQDPLLRAILSAQWPDFGTPPTHSAFGFHGTVAADFLHGGYYPVGGAKEIARHAAMAIEEQGGVCLVSHDVKSILVEGGKAAGVVVQSKGRERIFRAPCVISNAGVGTTFGKLVPPEYCQKERAKVRRLTPGPSAVVLYLGLNDDPRKHGFDEANYWMFSRLDHDYHARYREGQPERVDGAFLSFCSLRNPSAADSRVTHTAQIVTLSDHEAWKEFAGTKWQRRGDAYLEKKAEVSERLLEYVEERLPGVRQLVAYHELSTPLSVEDFVNHAGGLIYGQACDSKRLFEDGWPVRTSLPRLLMTGSDVGTPGVNGALYAGVMTAAKALGPFGLSRIMTKAFSQ